MSEGVVLTLAPRLHVSVDFWRRARLPLAAHFLTHMHADHTEGLGDDWRAPQGGPIYCSPATLQLLQVGRASTAEADRRTTYSLGAE
jgi:phosphoribosyl 1,2-cyclic phosphodiesterase